MPDLLIRIKKKTDGGAALSCQRADGSTTWQRQDGRQGRFFPIHDLTHYAVETVLGHRRGFYGLVADGWDLTDFGAPWPKGRLPADMDPSELLVGFLDTERAGGVAWTAADFNDKASLYAAQHRTPDTCRITPDELEEIRNRLSDLVGRWRAVPAGETLELVFQRTPEG
ncbi:MAG TPA: hypothetical protein VGP87_16295 [Gemmatimonadales bacterium]|nr:hypothetical protein [Gemmatimonadales bacterium]